MSAGAEHPWRIAGGRLVVRVRLTPKSSRDAVEGLEATAEGPAIKARVRAVPEDGAANAALERLIADWLGVAKGDVQLEKGGKSRVKSLTVAGEPGMLLERLEKRLAELV
jgi:uncharacterized protein YggU (UPF0235/DUF167 family)